MGYLKISYNPLENKKGLEQSSLKIKFIESAIFRSLVLQLPFDPMGSPTPCFN